MYICGTIYELLSGCFMCNKAATYKTISLLLPEAKSEVTYRCDELVLKAEACYSFSFFTFICI